MCGTDDLDSRRSARPSDHRPLVIGDPAGAEPLPRCPPCRGGGLLGVPLAGSAGQVQDGVGVRCGFGQRAGRLRRGQEDKVDLAAAGLVADVLHHRQRAVSAGADDQPAASPRDVLRDRERGVPAGAAELPRRGLLALADLAAVDDEVVVVGHAVDPYRAEGVAGESHDDAPSPHRDRLAGAGRPGPCPARCPGAVSGSRAAV